MSTRMAVMRRVMVLMMETGVYGGGGRGSAEQNLGSDLNDLKPSMVKKGL